MFIYSSITFIIVLIDKNKKILMNSSKLLSITLSLVLIAGISSPSFAQELKDPSLTNDNTLAASVAPDHNESGDAGDLPGTAQNPGGSGPLTSIAGSAGDGDVDMYQICITDPIGFSATTVGMATFDTQLFLFDSNGLGVYQNDDDVGLQSTLPSGDPNSPTVIGIYYLAVNDYNNEAQSAGGYIFPTGAPFSSVYGPTGPGGASPIISWDGGDFPPGGTYTIVLTGASAPSECEVVGGDFLPIDTTALLLAGAQTNALWILSALAVIGSISFGALYITSKKQ